MSGGEWAGDVVCIHCNKPHDSFGILPLCPKCTREHARHLKATPASDGAVKLTPTQQRDLLKMAEKPGAFSPWIAGSTTISKFKKLGLIEKGERASNGATYKLTDKGREVARMTGAT